MNSGISRFPLTLLLACLSLGAQAEGLKLDPWTTGDTWRQAAVTGLLVADWGQTRWIVRHPQDPTHNGVYTWRAEGNPLLGDYPSIGKVNTYFAAAAVGHAAISYILPRGWRDAWQYVWIGAEANQVRRNYYMGIKLAF